MSDKYGYPNPAFDGVLRSAARKKAMEDQGLPEGAHKDFYRWTIEVWVDPTWVADGFDLKDNDRVHNMMAHTLPYAYGHEIGGMVLEGPDPKAVRKEQGYED